MQPKLSTGIAQWRLSIVLTQSDIICISDIFRDKFRQITDFKYITCIQRNNYAAGNSAVVRRHLASVL